MAGPPKAGRYFTGQCLALDDSLLTPGPSFREERGKNEWNEFMG